jgi:catechol 2,3-dioxygenase-like lactoylglutathione lyase family enzyme
MRKSQNWTGFDIRSGQDAKRIIDLEKTMSKSGIPSAIGVDHVAITVPDLQQALDFFVNVLGCEHAFTAGPFSDPTGTWMETNLAVDPRAATTLAMVRCGPTQNVEIFQYDAPDQVTRGPRNSDIGASHIAFRVTDMAAAVAYLRAQPGVTVLGDPTPVSGQPNGGLTFVYFQTPWGLSMELVCYERLDYEATTSTRLFTVGA